MLGRLAPPRFWGGIVYAEKCGGTFCVIGISIKCTEMERVERPERACIEIERGVEGGCIEMKVSV